MTVQAQVVGPEDEIRRIRPGFAADAITVKGDPFENTRTMEDVHFVVRAGRVVKRRSSEPAFGPAQTVSRHGVTAPEKRRVRGLTPTGESQDPEVYLECGFTPTEALLAPTCRSKAAGRQSSRQRSSPG